jgi:transcriptional regulator of NAD metabolism
VYELFELRYKLHQQIYQHPIIGCVEMMILDVFNCEEFKQRIVKEYESAYELGSVSSGSKN